MAKEKTAQAIGASIYDNTVDTNKLDKSEAVLLDVDDCNLAPAGSKLENSKWNLLVPKQIDYPKSSFFDIGFSHHRTILTKVKDTNERIFYIRRCASEKYSREELTESIERDDYHHQGNMPNNFIQTLPAAEQAFCAINAFKDEYLLDYIDVEEIVWHGGANLLGHDDIWDNLMRIKSPIVAAELLDISLGDNRWETWDYEQGI